MTKLTTQIIHKEIDLIQSCISRMAHNSFLIKGWAISIVAVVLALTEKTTDNYMITAILIIPLICFWFLDAFFLQTEKKYREMYVDVLVKRKNDNDEFLYDLNPKRYDEKVKSKFRLMFSKTLGWFYGIPILIVIIILGFQIYTRLGN
ncbi:MAG: hypothetical protein PHT46_01000 [Candidatus Marinimicrobia bacterium]|nr:hypothetical protein [Candidatus Neomarinimicrobiota bacterium]